MGFLTPSMVLEAYRSGVFPMAHPEEDNAIYWYEPTQRGVLPLNGFKLSKSLKKRIDRREFQVSIDTDFPAVIRACAEREETWISEEIQQVYIELHELGWAHSVECRQEEKLVGGLYGVAIGHAFFGESMFHKKTDASKVALFYLVQWLKKRNFALLDMQFLTPHLASMGGIEISQEEYLELLRRALK